VLRLGRRIVLKVPRKACAGRQSQFPHLGGRVSDPEIWTGKILVGVTNPSENSRREIEKRLQQAGAGEIKRSA
jgi:hypothetical protein